MTAWMQSAAGQAAFASIASQLTARFEEAQSATAESQLSPVASALAATELDPAERRALSIASSKTWSVA